MAEHDSLYHRLFSHPVMVEQLVRDFLPDAMAVGLDFGGMERVVAKFHDRTGQRRDSDVIWRLPTLDGPEIYLHLLLEFQSSSDWWMAVRAQVYEGLLWQQVIAEKQLKAGDLLPPVLLVVLHNGSERWTGPVDTTELVGLPEESPLWSWQPRIRYHLVDMGRMPVADLARRKTLAALLFRLEQRHAPEELSRLIGEVVSWFGQHPEAEALKRLFTELVRQAIYGLGPLIAVPEDLRVGVGPSQQIVFSAESAIFWPSIGLRGAFSGAKTGLEGSLRAHAVGATVGRSGRWPSSAAIGSLF